MDYRSEGSVMEVDHARHQKQKIIQKPLGCRVTLPEDVLLLIFDYYLAEAGMIEKWHVLVHVCQNWRYTVFRSPLRLNLQILCSEGTPVRKKLAIWPPLPIIIRQFGFLFFKQHEDNILTALGHNDRVIAIDLFIRNPELERVFSAMQKTFVALKSLRLHAIDGPAPAVSDSFLGGSAPHLRHLQLTHFPFPFPVVRKLLLSAPNLVTLSFRDIPHIPHSGYSPPKAMVTCLSALTRLETLDIVFQSPHSRPPRKRRHPMSTRSVLPALTELKFSGVSKYLENLVTRIDAPLLNHFSIIFFHQLIFDTPQIAQFISRTPKLEECDEARVTIDDRRAIITLPGRDNLGLRLQITCRQTERQLLSLAQICRSSFPQALFPMPECLYLLEHGHLEPIWQDEEGNQWLELLHLFTTVKNLYLSQGLVPRIVQTLQAPVEERVTEVLPNLQSIFLEDSEEAGFVPEVMQQFIAARQLSSRPIAISHWTREDKQSTLNDYDA